MLADASVEGRHDPRVAQIDPGDLEVGVGLVHGGLRSVALRLPFLHVGLRGGVLFDETLLTRVLRGCLRERRLLLLDRGLGELNVGLVGLGLDHEQQVVLLHEGAILEIHRIEVARDPGDQIDAVARLGVAGQLDVVGHRLLHGPGHGDRGRWRRDVAVLLLAAGEGCGGQRRQGDQGLGPAPAGERHRHRLRALKFW